MIGIIGVGHALPARFEDNEELCETLTSTTPEWILSKTGITGRYLVSDGESAASLAASAARDAIGSAGIEPDSIGLVIVCTFSGDNVFPPVSAQLAGILGLRDVQSFDIQANCAGFVTGLTVATDRLRADPDLLHALVIGVETHTRFIDRTDVDTAIYFSDGAGAALLGPVGEAHGLLASAFHTDASNWESVRMRWGGAIEQNGLATWRQAVSNLPPTIRRACAKASVELTDVDIALLHQANGNLISYVLRKLRIEPERTVTNVERIGNTGAASVAIVLSEAVTGGRIESDDIVVLAAVGAGFTFGASVWRWQ